MKNYSLRQRLITRISIPVSIALLLAMLMGYYFTKREVEEVYDAQLVHSAKVLLQLTTHEILEDKEFDLGLEDPNLQHRYERKLAFRIWVNDKLITASANSSEFKDFEAAPGFSDYKIGKYEWRFFVFLDPVHNIKVEVSERNDIRYELVYQLTASMLVPILLLLPFVIGIIWIGVRKVLKPVVKISSDVDKRGSGDLSAISSARLPEEIAPLIQALNRLFNRLDESFKREREFTDHAAHELRTPLAAMKTQTQVLKKKMQAHPEYKDGFDNLEASIDRATHMITQLLLLARLQNEKLPQEEIDLSTLLRKTLEDFTAIAQSKGITLHLDISKTCMTTANPDATVIVLRNLIDNAFKYTPANGQVKISLSADGIMEISDTGPGLSDNDKKRVFERFVRADKSGQTGSGLGLSISRWIAEQHDLKITLHDNKPHGLTVRIEWKILT